MKTHQITSHDMTWHLATNHITSPHVTSQPTALLHRSLQPTTSKQVTTSPPWNGWRLVHSNNSVWASQWLVTLCTFYRQILSLTYSFFSLKLPPPACPALLVYNRSLNAIRMRCRKLRLHKMWSTWKVAALEYLASPARIFEAESGSECTMPTLPGFCCSAMFCQELPSQTLSLKLERLLWLTDF